jgi:hypothetical protein
LELLEYFKGTEEEEEEESEVEIMKSFTPFPLL